MSSRAGHKCFKTLVCGRIGSRRFQVALKTLFEHTEILVSDWDRGFSRIGSSLDELHQEKIQSKDCSNCE